MVPPIPEDGWDPMPMDTFCVGALAGTGGPGVWLCVSLTEPLSSRSAMVTPPLPGSAIPFASENVWPSP
jgi:hypothetical protein